MTTIFKNCLISTGFQNEIRTVDIQSESGKIIKIDNYIDSNGHIIDVAGNLLVPGAIDPHVHFNDPGFTHHEDFQHGTASAAKGGVTTIIDMPCTSIPPVTNLSNLKTKLKAIENEALVDFALWGGVSALGFVDGIWENDMDELSSAGVVGFKTYAISGMKTFPALSYDQLYSVLKKAKSLDMIVGHHAEDPEIIHKLTTALQNQGRNDVEAYWLSRPVEAELKACKKAMEIAGELNTQLHIVHLASADVIQLAHGSNVSFETCPQYLAFSKDDLLEKGAYLKTAPVVKTKEDSTKLWKFLATGKIQFLATDHAPCTITEKETDSIWDAYGGIPGTEHILNFAYSEGVRKGRLTLARMIEVTSTNAAMRFGLYPQKGALLPGADADFAIIDTQQDWVVDSNLQSKAQFTPFEEMNFNGRIIATYLHGDKVYDFEKGVVFQPQGRWVRKLFNDINQQ